MTDAPLNLLAPDGIIRVSFADPLSADQALAVLNATEAATSVEDLEQALCDLAYLWRMSAEIEIVSQKVKAG